MRTAKEQREIRFIYNKHNKSTKYKLEIDGIVGKETWTQLLVK